VSFDDADLPMAGTLGEEYSTRFLNADIVGFLAIAGFDECAGFSATGGGVCRTGSENSTDDDEEEHRVLPAGNTGLRGTGGLGLRPSAGRGRRQSPGAHIDESHDVITPVDSSDISSVVASDVAPAGRYG
jgi:hypothetical protein